MGGSTPYDHDGRLEIFTLGHWATVCRSNWDLEDATVACRQLGFSTALPVHYGAKFRIEHWNGLFSLVSLDCTGHETNLTQCGYSRRYSSCSPAGVNCSGMTNCTLNHIIYTVQVYYVYKIYVHYMYYIALRSPSNVILAF